mgnify:CR=1 FL=1
MKMELDELAKKFQAYRNKRPSKKPCYPPHLQKSAAELSTAMSSKDLAEALGVSRASIKVWARKHQKPEPTTVSDIIPVTISSDLGPALDLKTSEVSVKVISMEVKVPISKLAETLNNMLTSLGGSPC